MRCAAVRAAAKVGRGQERLCRLAVSARFLTFLEDGRRLRRRVSKEALSRGCVAVKTGERGIHADGKVVVVWRAT